MKNRIKTALAVFWYNKSEPGLQLVDELEELLRDATDTQEGQKYQEALITLQELIHSKHHLAIEEILKVQEACFHIKTIFGTIWRMIYTNNIARGLDPVCPWLQRASENIDTETGNMQTVIKDDNITLCLWANLNKNPRFVYETVQFYHCI